MTTRRTIRVIDTHAAGEPGRVVLDQHLRVRGATMAERLENAREDLEDLRTVVLNEPRGYPAMCAPVIVPPVEPGSDFGMIVMEQGGFRPMSGSNLICAVTALVETQQVVVTEPVTHLRVDTAAGTVAVQAHVEDGSLRSVTFDNVPAFVLELDRAVEVPHYGTVHADIVFGGQFYVQARAEQFGLELDPREARHIIRAASALVAAAREQVPVAHPTHPGITEIGLPMLWREADGAGGDACNAVVLPNGTLRSDRPESWTGTLDRSPCGTGTSGRMAALHARGRLALGQEFRHRSMLGTTFTGTLLGETTVGPYPAVLPRLTGRGWITGFTQLVIDADDPFPQGYMLGDIWGSE